MWHLRGLLQKVEFYSLGTLLLHGTDQVSDFSWQPITNMNVINCISIFLYSFLALSFSLFLYSILDSLFLTSSFTISISHIHMHLHTFYSHFQSLFVKFIFLFSLFPFFNIRSYFCFLFIPQLLPFIRPPREWIIFRFKITLKICNISFSILWYSSKLCPAWGSIHK